MRRVIPILTAIFMLYLSGCEGSSTNEKVDVNPMATSSVERMPLAALADSIRPAIEAQKIDSVESEILKLNPDAIAGTDTEWKGEKGSGLFECFGSGILLNFRDGTHETHLSGR